MKTILKKACLYLILTTLIISCTKSGYEKSLIPSGQESLAFLSGRQPAIAASLLHYLNQNNPSSLRLATGPFIIPFFAFDSWGVMKLDPVTNTYESVIFAATVLDKNDFYRLNNDGTVSIHVNSKKALAQYYSNTASPTGLYLSSTEATYSANYTGPVVEFPELGIKFIDLDNGVPRALSLHGTAKLFNQVQGTLLTLIAKVVQTPSGQTQREFSLR